MAGINIALTSYPYVRNASTKLRELCVCVCVRVTMKLLFHNFGLTHIVCVCTVCQGVNHFN